MFIKKQAGLSLIELLIGILIGMIVVAVAIKIFTGSAQNGQEMTQNNRLERDLRNMMDMMVREIKRAGYVNSAVDMVDPTTCLNSIKNNPYSKITIEATPIKTNPYPYGCITFMYNKDEKPVIANNELMGFKLVLDTSFSPDKPVLKMWKGGTPFTCNTGSWETITSPEVEITNLNFELSESPVNVPNPNSAPPTPAACNSGNIQLIIRTVTITLSGVLRKNGGNGGSMPETEQTITDTVKIRNDMYCHNGVKPATIPTQCN